jgi:tRNA threonylcarbamoyladenosine biosynthesis protein TsaB
MNILAIETTSTAASVALIDACGVVAFESSVERLNHLQNLMPMIDALLEKSQLQISDVNCIAVSEGPGSFTGIRIGMAAAKGLAQVLDVQVIPVPTLKAMVYNLPGDSGILCPMLDARRSQVYAGAYRWQEPTNSFAEERIVALNKKTPLVAGNVLIELIPGGAYTEAEFKGLVEDLKSNQQEDLPVRYLGEEYQLAYGVAKLGLELYNDGCARSLFAIRPVYMRMAEAERKLLEQEKGKTK